MINASKVDNQFSQTGYSCVLASYGIVGNYFTGQEIADFFVAYCEHFSLQFPAGAAGEAYDKHFHTYIEEKKFVAIKPFVIFIIVLHNRYLSSAEVNLVLAFIKIRTNR
ncbi:MAG: hypothetical protein C4527_11920 [Candidatus Omnitrophota bacterium]|jgi:hypothetical protein|nr:MAG: hypothetical protein C4527_11920 [Candidatus Omnitrophota bacterium]